MILATPIAALGLVAGLLLATPASAQRLCSTTTDKNCLQTYCGVGDGPNCKQAEQVVYSGNNQITVATVAAADQKKPDGKLDSLTDLSKALTACWAPPPADDAFSGMQMTARFSFNRAGNVIGKPRMTFVSDGAPKKVRDLYLDAIGKSLAACTPLALTDGFANAIAGRPISFRIIDDRKQKRADK